MLTETKLRQIIKEELKKVLLLREFDTDWISDYTCEELPGLLNSINDREFDTEMERDFAIRIIKDRIQTCSEPEEY